MTMAFVPSRRRALTIAAIFFFIASTYLCATRLFSMSFTRESFSFSSPKSHGEITTPNSSPEKPAEKPVEPPVEEKKPEEKKPEEKKPEDKKPVEIKVGAADLPMSYGGYGRPKFDEITLMESLSDDFVPTADNGRRLIVVGDIHGMSESFSTLLKEVNFNPTTDHIIAAGDMVHKGPDSRGVLTHLMDLNASAVRGNHEDRVLLSLAEAETRVGVSADLASHDYEQHRGQADHLAVGRSLLPEHIEWLTKLPVILTVDPLRVAIVHAGLVPGVALSNQDPWAVMNMRSLIYPRKDIRIKEIKDAEKKEKEEKEEKEKKEKEEKEKKEKEEKEKKEKEEKEKKEKEEKEKKEQQEKQQAIQRREDTPEDDSQDSYSDRSIAVPIESHNGELWAEAWSRWQSRENKDKKLTVVYGHDSKTGFKESDHAIGLDSGCVSGGELTALIIEGTVEGFKHSISKVKCSKPT